MLPAAAVIGRGFSFDLLEELADLDEDSLYDSIEAAERAQLIRSKTDGVKVRFIFSHELIRQTLVSSLSLPRRQRAHLRVAETIERLHAGAMVEHAADLAYHFYQGGGDTEKIISYSVMAAERATAQTAYEEAVEQYQRAVQALQLQQPVDELRHCDLLLALGRAYENAGDPPRAKQTFLKVTEIARRLPAPAQFAEATRELCALLHIFGVLDSQLLGLINEGLVLLGEEDSALRASLLARLSFVLETGGDERGVALGEQAIAMARRVGDREALWYALLARVYTWDRPLEERIADGIELVRLEEEGTRPEVGTEVLNYLSHCYRVQGNIAAWEKCLAIIEKRAAETQHPGIMWTVIFLKGAQGQLLGQFEEAERQMLEALVLGQKVDETVPTQGFRAFLFFLRYLQGRLGEIDEAFHGRAEQYPTIWDIGSRHSQIHHSWNMRLHLAMGREEEAREEFERFAAKDFIDLPRNWLMPSILMSLSTVAAAFGDKRRAALLYDLLHTCHDRLFIVGINNACLGAKSHWLGLMAATLKRWDDAVVHFEDALELSAKVGTRPWLARSQHEYARMLLERNESGDKEKAESLLSEATTTYRELGMPTFLEDAEELLRNMT
jgi:tetratricopeptide (TPR) repeat protein